MTEDGAHQRVQLSEETGGAERFLVRETIAGRHYLLVRREADVATWKVAKESPERRTAPRSLKQAKLGRERLF